MKAGRPRTSTKSATAVSRPEGAYSGARLRKRAMSHKYHPGQLVRLSRVAYLKLGASAGALYEVTRLMPADQSGEVSYRIKSTGAGERAVCEAEITAYLP
jgi:hypothetical protein